MRQDKSHKKSLLNYAGFLSSFTTMSLGAILTLTCYSTSFLAFGI